MTEAPIFCTVFDKNYLYQGLAMYRSLERTITSFRLYCLAMDDIAVATLKKLNLKSMIIVSLNDLNQTQLEELRPLVTYGQFCWSMQPLLCKYVLDQNEPHVTYIEADAFFFSSAQVALDEIGNCSISLAPHWYSESYQTTAKDSGIYCTHFNYFKNNENGRRCIEYWRTQCFLYRADRPAYVPGQLCLDEWEKIFEEVAILKNRGVGVAPWNVQQYLIKEVEGIPTVNNQKVIFYHFHQVGKYPDGRYELGDYPLSISAIHFFYAPYIRAIQASEKEVAEVDRDFHFYKKANPAPPFFRSLISFKIAVIKKALRPYKRKLTKTYNVFDPSDLVAR